MSKKAALVIASERSDPVDVVVVDPTADPPVCRLQPRKVRTSEPGADRRRAAGTPAARTKEVHFSNRIDNHDFDTKLHKVVDFLVKKHPVRIVVNIKVRACGEGLRL